MQSAFDFDSSLRVPLCLGIIVVITIANLRGLRESGALFAPPTYLYIVMLGVLIVVGLYRVFFRDLGPIPLEDLSEEARELAAGTATLSLFMLLRAFSSGAVALSGVEAVSNGVQTFRKPESRNASIDPGDDGSRAGGRVSRHLGARVAPPAVPGRARPDRDRPDGRVRLRRQERAVLGDPAGDVRHPRARRQHRLRRVPGPLVDHRPRRLPPAADGQPGRQVGVLQRHHLPRRRRRGSDHRLRRQRHRADPAVRLRRVHRLHAEPGRDGRPPLPRARAAVEGLAQRSTASARR